MRVLYADPPMPVARDNWEYADARTIRLLPAGTPFQNGHLYEFTYTAKDPLVAGLAFAGLRDLIEFLGTRRPTAWERLTRWPAK